MSRIVAILLCIVATIVLSCVTVEGQDWAPAWSHETSPGQYLRGGQWSPDLQWISQSENQRLYLVNTSTMEEEVAFPWLQFGTPNAWSPDSTALLVRTGDELMVINLSNQSIRWSIAGCYPCDAWSRWSPDGYWIAGEVTQGHISVHDSTNGTAVCNTTAFYGNIYDIAWSPDSSRLATVGYSESVQFWNASTCELEAEIPGDGVGGVAWDPTGTMVVAGTWAGTGIYNASSATLITSLSTVLPMMWV